jgi:hypothetical protein
MPTPVMPPATPDELVPVMPKGGGDGNGGSKNDEFTRNVALRNRYTLPESDVLSSDIVSVPRFPIGVLVFFTGSADEQPDMPPSKYWNATPTAKHDNSLFIVPSEPLVHCVRVPDHPSDDDVPGCASSPTWHDLKQFVCQSLDTTQSASRTSTEALYGAFSSQEQLTHA